jgi:hypothetical protein
MDEKSHTPESSFWQQHGVDSLARAIGEVYERVRHGRSRYWALNEAKLPIAARMAATAIVRKSPQFRLPYYGPLGRLDADGYDRLSALHGRFDALGTSALERARSLADLCVVAMLLDFDCGPRWRTRTRTGALLGSEAGTLVVTYALFVSGYFSTNKEKDPLRVDAEALQALDRAAFDRAFAPSEGAVAQGLDAAFMRLHAVVPHIATNAKGERRLGASIIDNLRACVRDGALANVPFDALFRESMRATMGAFEDRTQACAERPMTVADVHYASLAHSLAPLLALAGLGLDSHCTAISAPDRWSLSLLLDLGAIVPSNGQPLEPLLATLAAVEELYALASAALDVVVTQVQALTKTDDARLPKASVLAWGTRTAGRALSARERPGIAPLLWT